MQNLKVKSTGKTMFGKFHWTYSTTIVKLTKNMWHVFWNFERKKKLKHNKKTQNSQDLMQHLQRWFNTIFVKWGSQCPLEPPANTNTLEIILHKSVDLTPPPSARTSSSAENPYAKRQLLGDRPPVFSFDYFIIQVTCWVALLAEQPQCDWCRISHTSLAAYTPDDF